MSTRVGVTAVPPAPRAVPAVAPAPVRRRRGGADRARSAAVQRAYARRASRTGGSTAAPVPAPGGRTPFVVLVMALLSAALVATLWLSTAAAADSYRLQGAREQARDLSERAEALGQDVATLETAPELARRARELGMVPAGDPARLVVGTDGSVVVVGEPAPAVVPGGPAPPVPPPVGAARPAPDPALDRAPGPAAEPAAPAVPAAVPAAVPGAVPAPPVPVAPPAPVDAPAPVEPAPPAADPAADPAAGAGGG